MNEELVSALKVLLADTIALKYKAQGYHWNVESDDFKAWHEFFGEIYDNMEDATDGFAEWIRMLNIDKYAPFKLSRFMELTTVPETDVTADPMMMAADLDASIYLVTEKIVSLINMATQMNQHGLANFLADRQTAHQKFCWQLKASLKEEVEAE